MNLLTFFRQNRAFAYSSILEAFRNKIFFVVLVVAALAMGLAAAFGTLSLHQEERLFNNLVFFVGMLFLVILAIYQGVTSISQELSTKTVLTVLAKPVTRTSFLLGKYAANIAVLFISSILLFSLKSLIAAFLGYELHLQQLLVYLAGFYQLAIILALSSLFATFSGPFISALCTSLIFIAGNLTPQMATAAAEFRSTQNPAAYLLTIAQYIIPDFEKLNLSFELTYRVPIPWTYMVHGVVYTASTSALLLGISALIFARRDLS